jgi:two-component system sensor histidine kinase SenX3
VHRNAVAGSIAGARHAQVLVERAVQELVAGAAGGAARHRDLDLFGPPRQLLVLTAVPLDDGRRPAGALVLVEDVSERRRLEAVRRDFVANISHELKTPVGALGLLAETLAAEDDPALTRRLAGRMTNEAMRVGRIIDDLLALSRIEAEGQPPWLEPVPVGQVVHDALDRVRSLAEATGTRVDTSGVGARHAVGGDPRQLVSAVANLLENACNYSDPGSTVEVWSTTDGRWTEVSVRDHGIGIPARDLERIFERFYRVDRARSRDTGGTGLGLAIVRHVAGNHRGEVSVASEEGAGSTFTLRLPASPAPVAVAVGDPTPPSPVATAAPVPPAAEASA